MDNKTANKELKDLNSNPFTMDKIEGWLLKYADLRRNSKIDFSYSCFKDLPCVCPRFLEVNQPITNFNSCFDELHELAQLHKYESHFRKQMEKYELIKGDKEKYELWLIWNYELWYQKFSGFIFSYLLDSIDDESHLNVFVLDIDYKILVDRNDFYYTVKFLELVHHLYFERTPLGYGRISAR